MMLQDQNENGTIHSRHDFRNRWSGENCNWWVHLCSISFVILYHDYFHCFRCASIFSNYPGQVGPFDNTNWQGLTCTSVPQFGLYWNRANVFWERTPDKLNCFLPNPFQFCLNKILKNWKKWLSVEIVHCTFNCTSITIQPIHLEIAYCATCL